MNPRKNLKMWANCWLAAAPLALALTAAMPPVRPAGTPATDPINEVSCGPVNVESAQQMFRDKGKTKVRVAAVYGASATAGAAQKHTFLLEPNIEYLFIPTVYVNDVGATDRGADYNLRLKVTATGKNKVLLDVTAKASAGGKPLGELLRVKRGTVVEIDYDYTANGPDRSNNCLTLMVLAQPH